MADCIDIAIDLAHPYLPACAGLLYVASDIISSQWADSRISLPSFGPVSWRGLAGLAWPWWGRGGEGYSGLPMADTELYTTEGGSAACTNPPAAPYRPPERMPLLDDPQTFPSGP